MSTPQPNAGEGGIGIYARVSTEEQARGESVDRQIEAGHKFIQSKPNLHSLEVREYSDRGYSGHDFERPGIKRLMADMRAGWLRVVVIRDVSRLGRNVKLGLQFLDELHDAGGSLLVVSMPDLDAITTYGRRTFTDYLKDAESERGTYRDNSIFGQTTRAQRGLWKGGPPPVGYRVDHGTLKIVPAAAANVEKIYRLFSQKNSTVAVVKELSREGLTHLPRGEGHERLHAGKPIHTLLITQRLIWRLLVNPVYCGYVPAPRVVNQLNKHQVPDLVLRTGTRHFRGKHEPIIPEKLWHKIQAMLEQKLNGPRGRGRDTPAYLLQGLLTCFCCDKPLLVRAAQSRARKIYRYYACKDIVRRGTATSCTVRDVPADALEAAVIRFLSSLGQHPDIIAGVVESASKRRGSTAPALRGRIRMLKEERAKIERAEKSAVDRFFAVQDTAFGQAVTKRFDEFKARKAAIVGEIGELDSKLKFAEAKAATVAEVTAALAKFEQMVAHLPRPQLKELIQLLVAEISVGRASRSRNDRRRSGIAPTSAVFYLRIRLSDIGMKLATHPCATAMKAAAGQATLDRATVPILVTMEIRRGGPRGNTLHLLAPFGDSADTVELHPQSEREVSSIERLDHPLWRVEKIVELQSKGLLKKDIARSFGKTAPFVTYHLRLLRLQPLILQALKNAPLEVLRHFGLVRLMQLAAHEASQQMEAFEFEYRKASAAMGRPGQLLKPA